MNTLLGKKLGILGGGQLARMLALQAHKLGLEVRLLSNHPQDPAAQVVSHHRLGNPFDFQDVERFVKDLDLLTFESEFIQAKLLKPLESQKNLHIFPSLDAMAILQDRLSQKAAFQEAHLPTARFMALHEKADLKHAYELFKGSFVLKKRIGGYDGNGTFVIKSQSDLEKFLNHQDLDLGTFIAEEFISFKKECAFSMARNASGEMVILPLVEVQSFENKCDLVSGPIKHPAFNKLVAHCAHFLENLHYEGLCSFELFDTGSKLLVNETAPRVHNTAHYSLDALNIDQFTLHLKAGTNQIFYEVKSKVPAFAMANLLGTSNQTPEFPEFLTGQLHWYGKTENRPGRKMGHINYCGKSRSSLLKLAQKERDSLKNLGPHNPKNNSLHQTKSKVKTKAVSAAKKKSGKGKKK